MMEGNIPHPMDVVDGMLEYTIFTNRAYSGAVDLEHIPPFFPDQTKKGGVEK
jgi:hypothetical protein